MYSFMSMRIKIIYNFLNCYFVPKYIIAYKQSRKSGLWKNNFLEKSDSTHKHNTFLAKNYFNFTLRALTVFLIQYYIHIFQ